MAVLLPLGLVTPDAVIRGISQHSHLFNAGWFKKVHAEQFHCSPSPSESPDPMIGCRGGGGGTWDILGGRGGGTERKQHCVILQHYHQAVHCGKQSVRSITSTSYMVFFSQKS